MQRLTRRMVIGGGIAAAGAAAVSGIRAPAWAQAASSTPIRIGFPTDLTGEAAPSGRAMLNGMQMYLDQHNGHMAGRPVKLFVEDTATKPEFAVEKTRLLVEQEHVDVIIGLAIASSGYAVANYVRERGVPTLFPVVSSDDLTQRKRMPNLIRTGWSSSQPSHPFGEWVAKTLGYKKIATVGSDFSFAYEVVGGFQRTFEMHGGQIVQKVWPRLGTQDFTPFITQLRHDVDAVFAIVPGADAIRFVKSYHDLGLKGKIPLIGGGNTTDESLLPHMAPEDADGIVTVAIWSAALDRPEAKEFVDEYRRRFHQDAAYHAETTYDTAHWLDLALQHLGGKAGNADELLAAIRAIQLPNAPRGPIRLDSYQNPIENVYVRRVEHVNGRLQNTVIHTFPNVSQFWTFSPEKFLAQPVYSRDYPPCDHCS